MPTRPAPPDDPRRLVAEGHEACGAAYTAARARDAAPELAPVLEALGPESRVLDACCGAGVPVARLLARRARVTGVDVSAAQIARARRLVPEAEFVVGDVARQRFGPACFDAVVCLYGLFHLPRDEHGALLARFARWLRPGGLLLVSLAGGDDPGHVEPDFFGVPMYWSAFEPAWYERALSALGLEVLARGALGHGYEGAHRPERHPTLLARRA